MVFKSILNSDREYTDSNEFVEIYLKDSDNKKVCINIFNSNDKNGTYILKKINSDFLRKLDFQHTFFSEHTKRPSYFDNTFIWPVDIVKIPSDISVENMKSFIPLDVFNCYSEKSTVNNYAETDEYEALVFPFLNEEGVENFSDIVVKLQNEANLSIKNSEVEKYINEILQAIESLNNDYGIIFNEFHVSRYHPSRFYFRKNGSIIVDFSPLNSYIDNNDKEDKNNISEKDNDFILKLYNYSIYPLEFADPVISKYEIAGTRMPTELESNNIDTPFTGPDINSQNYSLAAFLFFLMYGQMPYWGYQLSGQKDNDIFAHYYIYRNLYLSSPAFIFDKEDHIDNDIADYGYEAQVQQIWDESSESVKKAFLKVLSFDNALRFVVPDNPTPGVWSKLITNDEAESSGEEKAQEDNKSILNTDSVNLSLKQEKEAKETKEEFQKFYDEFISLMETNRCNKPAAITQEQIDLLKSEGEKKFKEKNYEEALKYFKALDENEILFGSEMLADTYLELKKYEEAEEVMIKCIEKGSERAAGNLFLKLYDKKILYDPEKSFKYAKKAAELGNITFMHRVGYYYETGKGVEENKEKAAEWYKKSLTVINNDEKYPLEHLKKIGDYYFNDSDDEKKYQKAIYCLEKVVEINNDDDAMLSIGKCYYYGRYGIKPDDEIAAQWFKRSADAGNDEAEFFYLKLKASEGERFAQCNLGRMYEEGRGVEKDAAKAFEWYQKAAAQGYVEAQYNIGVMYAAGIEVKKDNAKAFEWYQKAAELGYAEAQKKLGSMYQEGIGVEKDAAKAFEWYQKAAEQGDEVAQFGLGRMYEEGRGVEKDDVKAFEWYQKAAEQGDEVAQLNLGWMYEKGRGVEEDDAKAVEWYQKAAEQGYAGAQNNLGWMYEEGRGIKKNAAKAVEWYQKAAEQGEAAAQKNLGLMYEKGRGVEKDAAKAVEWYQKAAEQEYAKAQKELGWMYEGGIGVEKDDVKAFEWYQKAAEQGDESAQFSLDRMYREGRGVEKDAAKAFEWYQKAAEQGEAAAQFHLGWMYDKGRGVEKDDVKAFEWYQKAAEQGYAKAQYELGWWYHFGRRVEKDDAKAFEWYQKAAEQGYAKAQNELGWMYQSGCGVEKDVAKAVEWYIKAAKPECKLHINKRGLRLWI